MAQTAPRDRLQPSLLDRLIDEDRSTDIEAREQRVLTGAALRQAVLRDLRWLFNAVRPEAPYWLLNEQGAHLDTAEEEEHHTRFRDWSAFEEVSKSVLHYGLPCLSGRTASTEDLPKLRAEIRQVILDFEPRIIAGSLNVEAEIIEDVLHHHNLLAMRITAQLWAQPVPLELVLRTELDLESGQVQIQELSR